MPNETQQAVDWALQQTVVYPWGEVDVTKDTASELVNKVREYFNENNIEYSTFSYLDLLP
jgi:hypothetical protein